MSWFGWKKKKCGCCCGVTPENGKPVESAGNPAGIQILGGGCSKCNQLELITREALAELGIQAKIEHVTDFARIAACGVMTTPALVIRGKVVVSGRVPGKEEIVKLLMAQQE